ncbi:MAG: CxxxxCH/CxxCH domain-containing protein [Myxococcota bacterium]
MMSSALPALAALLACLTPAVPAGPDCTSCHGTPGEGPGPPAALGGVTDPASPGVGSHARHAAPNVSRAVPCTECHVVPAQVDDPGHIDTPWPAEVAWGELAAVGAAPFDAGALTCTVYCHSRLGAAEPEPEWIGGQVGCGSCHGDPPPPPHPVTSEACSSCHPGGGSGNPEAHVDGTLQLEVDGLACDTCHGGPDNAAPPLDTQGRDDTALVTVGAHQTHLAGGRFSAPVACATCHVVPGAVSDEGHLDAPPAEVRPGAGFDGARCDSACHAGPGASTPRPQWTVVDGSQARCGACHGLPPPDPHPQDDACADCHSTAGPDFTIAVPEQHADGVVDF